MSFKNISKLAESLKGGEYEIELEIRLKIPPPITFKADIRKTITYFRSSIYPTITFRSTNNYEIETKELIEKRKIHNTMVYLSIEQKYYKYDINIPLIKTNKRQISRMKIQDDPLTEIIKHNDEYTLEVEFNINNYNKVKDIIAQYSVNYFPLPKPIEISSNNLARKLSNNTNWCISLKADGLHVIVIEGEKSRILLFDNGETKSINNKIKRKMVIPINVYEAELMENNKLIYYDCLIHNKKDISNLDYIERRSYIDKNKFIKPIIMYESLEQVLKFMYEVPPFKTDGFIISNIKNKSQTFKSKFINTVDLKYKNGYLYLENEDISERIPKTNFEYEDDGIYEFNMNLELIKPRKDKIIANYKMPYDNNPLYKIVNGIGIPLLRNYHNKIKFKLLQSLPNSTLLDIGSGKGGDINKWLKLKFKTIYAVDPELNFRTHNNHIKEIKNEAQNIYNQIEYDCVSILFVPWDDCFIEIINKAKHAIIILMDKLVSYECHQFKCSVKKDKIELKIPESETATNITENKIEKNKIFEILQNKGWKIIECDFKYNPKLTKNEEILKSMYSYYKLTKC